MSAEHHADDDRFGPYVLHERIGDGGFADVFVASRADGRKKTGAPDLVIKRLHRHLCDQPEMVDMFVTEARVLAELDHPSIVRMFDLERVEDRWAMVMERVDGVDAARIFDHAMSIGQPLPLVGSVQLVLDVADALHHAHERTEHVEGEPMGIIHRDVKPDNLLVTWDGRVKLIDFGCAKATLQSHLTRPGIRKGTLDYMSPEQCLGRTVDRRTDVFSLGVVLYELLTMTRLYADASDARVMERIVHEVARPPSWIDSRVSASLDLVVLRALEKRPEERFGSAAEMARALQWWLDRYAPDRDGRREIAEWMRAYAPGGPSNQLQETTDARPGGELVLRRNSPEALRGVTRRSAVGAVDDDEGPGRGDVVSESRFVALQSLIGRRSNLSPETTPIVGRVALLREIEGAFESGAQVVALTGPPGVGKSRLADASLRSGLLGGRALSGGVWWCAAEDVTGHGHLAARLGTILGVDCPDDADEAVVTMARALAGRGPMRLCVDGADGLGSEAVEALQVWTMTAPELELILTTADAPEGFVGHEIAVPPMDLPARSSVLIGSEAADLFVQAAREVAPDFTISSELRAPLHALLRALGAMPAPMLVAAAQIAGGDPMEETHRLLALHGAVTRRPALDRDTLGAALTWVWEQLGPDERAVLAVASLFHGGFDLAGITAVAGAVEPPVEHVQATLENLRQRNLVTWYEPPERPGSRRLKVVRNARAFARERLLERDDVERARRAHAVHYVGVGDALAEAVRGSDGASAMGALRVELPNISAVLHRALRVSPTTERSASRATQAALALWSYTDVAGRYADFVEIATRVLEHVDELQQGERVPHRAEAALCVALARAQLMRADADSTSAAATLERARAAALEASDDRGLACVACASGELLLARNLPARAAPFFEEAVNGEPDLETVAAHVGLSAVARSARQLETAMRALQDAVEVARRLRLSHAEAKARLAAGQLAIDVDRFDAAQRQLRAALAGFEHFGDEIRAAKAQLELGRLASIEGDGRAARRLIRDAIARLQRVGRDDLARPYAALLGESRGG